MQERIKETTAQIDIKIPCFTSSLSVKKHTERKEGGVRVWCNEHQQDSFLKQRNEEEETGYKPCCGL